MTFGLQELLATVFVLSVAVFAVCLALCPIITVTEEEDNGKE